MGAKLIIFSVLAYALLSAFLAGGFVYILRDFGTDKWEPLWVALYIFVMSLVIGFCGALFIACIRPG